jgi:hypothetical protein
MPFEPSLAFGVLALTAVGVSPELPFLVQPFTFCLLQ